MSSNKSDDLKAVEGVRARMSKYNDALRKKVLPNAKLQRPVVGTLEESKKDVSGFLSPTKENKKKVGIIATQIGSLSSSIKSTFENFSARKVSKEEQIKEELQAKEDLGKLIEEIHEQSTSSADKTNVETGDEASNDNNDTKTTPIKISIPKQTTVVKSLAFEAVRIKYIKAIEACRPQSKKENATDEQIIEEPKAKKHHRKVEALKKDRFIKLREAWDKYEVIAVDKPKLSSAEETEIRQKIDKVEEEVNDTWVDYSKNVAKEIMVEMEEKLEKGEGDNDEEEEDNDMEYWINEAKRLKAEAEARRKAREDYLKQQAEHEAREEEEYWMNEALRLKELNQGKKKNKTPKKHDEGENDNSQQTDKNVVGESGEDGELINPYEDDQEQIALAAAAIKRSTQSVYKSPRFSPSKTTIFSPFRAPVISGAKDKKTPSWVKTNNTFSKASSSSVSKTAFLSKPIFDDDNDVDCKPITPVEESQHEKNNTNNIHDSPGKKSRVGTFVAKIGGLPSNMKSKFGGRKAEKESANRKTSEVQAKEELGILLEKTQAITQAASNSIDGVNVSKKDGQIIANCFMEKDEAPTRELDYSSVRTKYMAAIAECRPMASKMRDKNAESKETVQEKKTRRKAEADKKELFVNLQQAWDTYEETVQDKPALSTPGEAAIREQMDKTEKELVDSWVDYSRHAVNEISKELEEKLSKGVDVDDQEDDEEDMDYWINQAKRMKAEAEARRKAREALMRHQAESEIVENKGGHNDEEEDWMAKALRLKELNDARRKAKNKKSEKGGSNRADVRPTTVDPQVSGTIPTKGPTSFFRKSVERHQGSHVRENQDDRTTVDAGNDSPTKERKSVVESFASKFGGVSSSVKSKFGPFGIKKAAKESKAEALEAKEELSMLLDTTRVPERTSASTNTIDNKKQSNQIIANSFMAKDELPTMELDYNSVRTRYMAAIEECRPQASRSKGNTSEEVKETTKGSKFRRKVEAEKNERFVSLKKAWDKYRVIAVDKPTLSTAGESEVSEQIDNVEKELVDSWADYSKQAVQEIIIELEEKLAKKADRDDNGEEDSDDETDDMDYWINEAKRLKAEAEARRKAREALLREQAEREVVQQETEADEDWMARALRLKELSKARRKGTAPSSVDVADGSTSTSEKGTIASKFVDVLGEKAKKKKFGVDDKDDACEEVDHIAQGGVGTNVRKKKEFTMDTDDPKSPKKKYGRVVDDDSDQDELFEQNTVGGITTREKKSFIIDVSGDKKVAKKKSIGLSEDDSDGDDNQGSNDVREPRRKVLVDDNDPKINKKKFGQKTFDDGSEVEDDDNETAENHTARNNQGIRKKKEFEVDDSDQKISKKSIRYGDDNYDDESDDVVEDGKDIFTEDSKRKEKNNVNSNDDQKERKEVSTKFPNVDEESYESNNTQSAPSIQKKKQFAEDDDNEVKPKKKTPTKYGSMEEDEDGEDEVEENIGLSGSQTTNRKKKKFTDMGDDSKIKKKGTIVHDDEESDDDIDTTDRVTEPITAESNEEKSRRKKNYVEHGDDHKIKGTKKHLLKGKDLADDDDDDNNHDDDKDESLTTADKSKTRRKKVYDDDDDDGDGKNIKANKKHLMNQDNDEEKSNKEDKSFAVADKPKSRRKKQHLGDEDDDDDEIVKGNKKKHFIPDETADNVNDVINDKSSVKVEQNKSRRRKQQVVDDDDDHHNKIGKKHLIRTEGVAEDDDDDNEVTHDKFSVKAEQNKSRRKKQLADDDDDNDKSKKRGKKHLIHKKGLVEDDEDDDDDDDDEVNKEKSSVKVDHSKSRRKKQYLDDDVDDDTRKGTMKHSLLKTGLVDEPDDDGDKKDEALVDAHGNKAQRKKNLVEDDDDDGNQKSNKKKLIENDDSSLDSDNDDSHEIPSEKSTSRRKKKQFEEDDGTEKGKKNKQRLTSDDGDNDSDDATDKKATKNRRKKYIDSDSEEQSGTKQKKKIVVDDDEDDDSNNILKLVKSPGKRRTKLTKKSKDIDFTNNLALEEQSSDQSDLGGTNKTEKSRRKKHIDDDADPNSKSTKHKKKSLLNADDLSDSDSDNIAGHADTAKALPSKKVGRKKKNIGDDDHVEGKQKQKKALMKIEDSDSDEDDQKLSRRRSTIKRSKEIGGANTVDVIDEANPLYNDTSDEQPESKAKNNSEKDPYLSRTKASLRHIANKGKKGNDKDVEAKKSPFHGSADDFDEEETDESNNGDYRTALPKHLMSSGEYDYDSDASMSDTVQTDDESVKNKIKNKVIPFQAKKKMDIKEETQALEKKPLNMDGTNWVNPLTQWNNEPKKKVIVKNTKISMPVPASSDCWRKTLYGFTKDNAPFNYQPITSDEFEVLVNVTAKNFQSNYQKAGLMIRTDESHWIFTGIEYLNGKVYLSTITTNDYSDRTTFALPLNAETAGVWFCMKMTDRGVESYYSFDGKLWKTARQCLFPKTGSPIYVGICGASPTGNDLVVNFDYYKCTTTGESVTLKFNV